MAQRSECRRKVVPDKGRIRMPAVAIRRQTDYQNAVLRELRRREDTGEPLDVNAIVLAATYQGSAEFTDGTPLNRTTVYAKKRDGTRVHADIFTAITEAVSKRAALQRRVRQKRTAAEYEVEIANRKRREVKFANQVIEARTAELQALQSKKGTESLERARYHEVYLMCKVIAALTTAQAFRVRSVIQNFEREVSIEIQARLSAEAEEIVREIRERAP